MSNQASKSKDLFKEPEVLKEMRQAGVLNRLSQGQEKHKFAKSIKLDFLKPK